jgi:hypothetical protein
MFMESNKHAGLITIWFCKMSFLNLEHFKTGGQVYG